MKSLLAISLALAFALTQGQSIPKPVTRSDFYVALNKLTTAADSVLGNKARSGTKPDHSDEPITRAAMVKALKQTFDHFRPSFKVAPRPAMVVQKAIDDRNSETSRADLKVLVRWGFVAPVGPLVTGPGESLNAKQIGDALGYFFSQVSVLTHTAVPKWTPRIESQ